MYFGNAKQFQLYDSILLSKKKYKIEKMVLEAAHALFKHVPNHKKVLIFCGKGNNGADGLALASLIKRNVVIYYVDELDNASVANKYYLKQIQDMNIPIYYSLDHLMRDLNQCEVIVDAIFGTGFNGQLSFKYENIISLINENSSNKFVISVDIPSGMLCDNGVIKSVAIKANKTITFLASKIGFLNPDIQHYLGEVIIEKILYHQDVFEEVLFSKLINDSDLNINKRLYDGYKGTYGKLCCNVGSTQYPGAAILSVGAALNTGCGFVSYVGDHEIKKYLIPLYPEVVYQDNYDKADAILFGCGKGWNTKTAQELKGIISSSQVPLLIDADGINCLSENLDILYNKKSPIIVTPHIKEMERLQVGDSVLSAIEFARKYDVIVVLKGSSTMITDGKKCFRIALGDRAMAVAGMGDCLSGIIASLLAQKYDPIDACVLGVAVHGLSGRCIANDNYTVLPSRLIHQIPKVMKKMSR